MRVTARRSAARCGLAAQRDPAAAAAAAAAYLLCFDAFERRSEDCKIFIGSLAWGTDEYVPAACFCELWSASGGGTTPAAARHACRSHLSRSAAASALAAAPKRARHFCCPAAFSRAARRSRSLHQAFSNCGEVVEARVRPAFALRELRTPALAHAPCARFGSGRCAAFGGPNGCQKPVRFVADSAGPAARRRAPHSRCDDVGARRRGVGARCAQPLAQAAPPAAALARMLRPPAPTCSDRLAARW